MPKCSKITGEKNFLELWENEYKPMILNYREVPVDVVAEIRGTNTDSIKAELRSNQFNYGVARKCEGGKYRYIIEPLRLIAYIEGRM